MEAPNYQLVRSRRKTLAIQVYPDLRVVVRAPLRASAKEIEVFVEAHRDWGARHLEGQKQRREEHPEPTEAELRLWREKAREEIPPRVAYYSHLMGLVPTGVKITSAKTRYGSCSGKNSLCFSCLLMSRPREAVDYVVVHELAHICHKNHGREFYRLIESILPDWKERRALLLRRREGELPASRELLGEPKNSPSKV